MFNVMCDLAALGYYVTNAYADGVVRMVRDQWVAFVKTDGSYIIRYR